MNIKQPRRLSLCLMLLPDVATRGLSPSRSFPDHLCSLQHLTSVTLLIDEPRTNSYFMEYGVKQDLCMVAKSLEAICLSAAPVHTVVAGGLRCACLHSSTAAAMSPYGSLDNMHGMNNL